MKKYVFANWKANMSFAEIKQYFKVIDGNLAHLNNINDDLIIGFFAPYVYLPYLNKVSENVNFRFYVGSQNVSPFKKGAYTGEVCAYMLKDVGVHYVIIGHSERRTHFKEINEVIVRKIENSISEELKVVFCVGEPYPIRKENLHIDYVVAQIKEVVKLVKNFSLSQWVIIAYEPIWAIGTGVAASTKDIQEMHSIIKDFFKDFPVIYGGSVSPDNIDEIANLSVVDGVLVGSASLNPNSFAKIIQAFWRLPVKK